MANSLAQLKKASVRTRRLNLNLAILFAIFFMGIDANAVCVKANYAILKRGPGESHPQSGFAREYRPLKKLSTRGGWTKVTDSKRAVHWIESKSLTDSFQCATVKSGSVNTRTGPGTNYSKFPKRPKISKYFAAKVVEKRPEWVKLVSSGGNTFWVFKELLWIR